MLFVRGGTVGAIHILKFTIQHAKRNYHYDAIRKQRRAENPMYAKSSNMRHNQCSWYVKYNLAEQYKHACFGSSAKRLHQRQNDNPETEDDKGEEEQPEIASS